MALTKSTTATFKTSKSSTDEVALSQFKEHSRLEADLVPYRIKAEKATKAKEEGEDVTSKKRERKKMLFAS